MDAADRRREPRRDHLAPGTAERELQLTEHGVRSRTCEHSACK